MIQESDKLIADALKSNKGEDYWTFRGDAAKDYVHNMFAYPAMMVPKMQREILETIDEHTRKDAPFAILDPFMGSGTILVEGMLRGYEKIVGIDINPLAYLVTKVKTEIYSLPRLKRAIDRLLNGIDNAQIPEIETDFYNIRKWFRQDVIEGLEKIKGQIQQEQSLKFRRFMWVSFCDTIRTVSNARSTTYKLHIKTEEDIRNSNASALEVFKNCIQAAFKGVKSFQEELERRGCLRHCGSCVSYNGTIDLRLANSMTECGRVCKKYRPNLIITSPPYGDNETTVAYGQYSILELKWIDLQDIKSDLDESVIQTQSKIDRISLGGKIDRQACAEYRQNLARKSLTLATQIQDIEQCDPQKVWKVLGFYHDFEEVLSAFESLPSNAYVVMTVGNRTVARNRIQMNRILAELLANYGYESSVEFSRRIVQKRMSIVNAVDNSTGTTLESMNQEYILIMKKR